MDDIGNLQQGLPAFQSEMMSMANYYSSNHHGHHLHHGLLLGVNNNNNNNINGVSVTQGGSAGGGMVINNSCSSTISNNNNNSSSATSCLGAVIVDSAPGLKHDTGLAVEWSVEEQYRLEEGLAKFADEPSIMKYIKIAAMLHDKTVRDVALRCRWMTRKRRKQEDHNFGKKTKDKKDKLGESSFKTNVSTLSPSSMAGYSLSMNRFNQSEHLPSRALIGTKHLLDENNQALDQISANLSTLKLQENVDLFMRTRNNIAALLNDMRNMPGIMSQMPPLPVVINEDLASSIIMPGSSQMMFGSSSGIHLKQEPRC